MWVTGGTCPVRGAGLYARTVRQVQLSAYCPDGQSEEQQARVYQAGT